MEHIIFPECHYNFFAAGGADSLERGTLHVLLWYLVEKFVELLDAASSFPRHHPFHQQYYYITQLYRFERKSETTKILDDDDDWCLYCTLLISLQCRRSYLRIAGISYHSSVCQNWSLCKKKKKSFFAVAVCKKACLLNTGWTDWSKKVKMSSGKNLQKLVFFVF